MLQSQTPTQTTHFIPAAVQSSAPVRTIELERIIINDDMILVQSTSTCWVNTKSLKVDIESLPKLYTEVVKLAKGAGAKISYRYKTKKAIQDVMDAGAVEQLQTYNRLFGMLKAAWQQKVIVGISSPACDDDYYNELSEVKNSMEALTYHSTALGKALSLCHELQEKKQRLAGYIANHGSANGTTIFL